MNLLLLAFELAPVILIAYCVIDVLLFMSSIFTERIIWTPLARLAMWNVLRDLEREEKKEEK